jgi:hypothetical protein
MNKEKFRPLIILLFLLLVLPASFLSVFGYMKFGSFSEAWKDFSEQMGGINDSNPSIFTGSNPCLDPSLKPNDDYTPILIPIPELHWNTLVEYWKPLEKPVAYLQFRCRDKNAAGEQMVEFALGFVVRAEKDTDGILYQLDFYNKNNKKIISKELNGLYAIGFRKGDSIPVSLGFRNSKPFTDVPSRVSITQMEVSTSEIWGQIEETEPIGSRLTDQFTEISNISSHSSLSGGKFITLSIRERGRTKGKLTYRSFKGKGTNQNKWETNTHYVIGTDLEIRNDGNIDLLSLSLKLSVFDELGREVFTKTEKLWSDYHNFRIEPGSIFGFVKNWVLEDKNQFMAAKNYTITVERVQK